MDSMKEIILKNAERIARNHGYDFEYEHEHDELLCQILFRDTEGSILGTPLSFHLNLDEEKGKGEAIFYHTLGEFKRLKIDLIDEDSLLKVLVFINERLNFSMR